MVDWNPRDHMGFLSYRRFKRGEWVTVDSIPEWVQNASDPPSKTNIPINQSVEAVFTGDSLEYKVITKRLARGAGTYLEHNFEVRIKDK
jgi:hypothetical protein